MTKQIIKIIKRDKEILNFENCHNLDGVHCFDGMVRIDVGFDSTYIPMDLIERIDVEGVE